MSKFEMKEGKGSLFPNGRKESETHADWQGSIKIDGKEYWLNGWVKQGKTERIELSAKLKDPNKNVAAALKQVRTGHAPSSVDDDLNDPIPF